MIDNQINLFEQNESMQSFEGWLQDICFRVLDENTTEHKHVVIRKNKGYNALIYRNRIVFYIEILCRPGGRRSLSANFVEI